MVSPINSRHQPSSDSNGDSNGPQSLTVNHRPSLSARSIAIAASRKALGITWVTQATVSAWVERSTTSGLQGVPVRLEQVSLAAHYRPVGRGQRHWRRTTMKDMAGVMAGGKAGCHGADVQAPDSGK
jgi:hypothetical protein